MKYSVSYHSNAIKDLKKIDRHQAKLIALWIEKHLIDCQNPRQFGKALRYDRKDQWRYRVGDYRLIADIQDNVINIEIVEVGHRKYIYISH